MIFVNFKTYEQGTGENASSLVKIIENVSEQMQIKIIPVVQLSDLGEIVNESTVEVWAQNVEGIEYGSHTGHVLPEAVLAAGAKGTFLNHSEIKDGDFEKLGKATERAAEVGLKTLIFAADMVELEHVVGLKPDYVSYEPPELIGSSDKSVATERPEIITQAVEIAKKDSIPLIVGAGIHTREDIKTSLNLGASGFAIASGILKAKDPKAELLNLCSGYN